MVRALAARMPATAMAAMMTPLTVQERTSTAEDGRDLIDELEVFEVAPPPPPPPPLPAIDTASRCSCSHKHSVLAAVPGLTSSTLRGRL